MTALWLVLQRGLLFPLSFLAPRRRDTWVFGAPMDSFSGNPKYLFLWVSEHRPEIRAVWLTGSPQVRSLLRGRGYQCELRWSRAGLRVGLTAKYHFVANDGTDTCFSYIGGAWVFNLWHGVGIKNIVRGATVGQHADLYAGRRRPDSYLRTMPRFRRPELVLATSAVMSRHFARCFDVPTERCPSLGYPRLDPAADPAFRDLCLSFGDYTGLESLIHGRTTYLYAPTLRDDDHDLLAEAIPDFAALSAALRPTNGVLLLKLHPFTSAQVGAAVADLDNVAVWPEGLDLYPVLAAVDCLITDYSSILYDYVAVSDSGVVVYAFDYDRYVAKDRDLAFPLADNILGQRADTFEQLCEALRSGAALAELPAAELATIRVRFWGSAQPLREPASAAIFDFASGWKRPRPGDDAHPDPSGGSPTKRDGQEP